MDKKPNIIDIPGVGPVEFPDSMSQEEINAAAKKLYNEANPPEEKESPELFGGLGATAGAVGASGDIVFSKGRQLFRAGEKMFGLDDPNTRVKPRTFATPSQVAERAIGIRAPQMEGAPTAVENYGRSQFVSPEGKGVYYGAGDTGDYAGARKAAERAIQTEQMFPEMKVLEGKTPLAVPQDVAAQVEAQRAEARRAQDLANQREVNKVAEIRAQRLAERERLKALANRGKMLTGSQTVATKAGAPIIGGYELGSQGAQAYNRLSREDLQASDVASGLTNVGGAALGASAMMPGGKYRLPKALGSVAVDYLSDFLDRRNPRRSVLEEQPKPEMAGGGKVGALSQLMQLIKKQGGENAAKRLERAADLVPNLEKKFQPSALQSAFAGDNASAVMLMPPGDFEKYAMPISKQASEYKGYRLGDVYSGDATQLPKGELDDYLKYLDSVKQSGGFRDVPFLHLGQLERRAFPNIQGHEGRHRMRALEKAGEEYGLVRMIPTPNLREPFPRRSQEEYLEALQEKIGKRPFVSPEQTEEGLSRGLVELPELFKEGGSTTPAWQRKEGKSPSGGLNAIGRASYKRETGGELKPPQPEGGSRKKSFCARMGGMKKKLTSSKTANDPDSRINKALRKWDC